MTAPAGGTAVPQVGLPGGAEVGGGVGGVLGCVVGCVVGVPLVEPVQVVPFMANTVGAGLLPFQDPLKPNEVLALVARLPL
jgi:hypothetical protein